MGICFVGQKRKFSEFLGGHISLWPLPLYVFELMASVPPFTVNYLEPKPGPIRDLETRETMGTHKGLWTYTIGQGARLRGLKEKYFVTSKSKAENAIYVVNGS